MNIIKSYYKAFKFILSLFLYNEDKPPYAKIEIKNYNGINDDQTPVKIIYPINETNKVAILYPGASQAAEEHPKMDMLGRLLANIGFKVYIPRIPPLKKLNISEINVRWFTAFYKWIINHEKVDPQKIMMTGISYGGGIMLKSLLNSKESLEPPKTILTYGTYCNGKSMLHFLLNGEIIINEKKYTVKPHEWGLIVIFQNFLKNLNVNWNYKNLLEAIQLRIDEKIEESKLYGNKLPSFQKNIYNSIIESNPSNTVKELTNKMINNEKERLENLSPKYWADKIDNKIFIIHGANDSMVPYTESIQLANILPDSELFISYLYEHNEISTNRSKFFILKEIFRFINFYKKLFTHYEN